jgi:hypothetical protein
LLTSKKVCSTALNQGFLQWQFPPSMVNNPVNMYLLSVIGTVVRCYQFIERAEMVSGG